MHYKLFFTTFLLIFLAELGDKTQLTAMARAATADESKWVVFAAASAALVLSTLVAVLLGTTLTRIVPLKFIKIGAGTLFLVFGAATLYSACAMPAPKRGETAAPSATPSALSPTVLRLAAAFEEAAARDYERLAKQAKDPRVRGLLLALSADERSHLDRIRELSSALPSDQADHAMPPSLPERRELMHDVADDSRDLISHAIEHEVATQRFYEELARTIHVPGLAASFTRLAQEEAEHVRRLTEMADTLAG